MLARGQAAQLPEARRMLLKWFAPMTAAIQREQQRVGGRACARGRRAALGSLACAFLRAACRELPGRRLVRTDPWAALQPARAHMLSAGAAHISLPPGPRLLIRRQIIEGAKGIDRKVYGPYLLLLEPEQLAVLTMHRYAQAEMRPETFCLDSNVGTIGSGMQPAMGSGLVCRREALAWAVNPWSAGVVARRSGAIIWSPHFAPPCPHAAASSTRLWRGRMRAGAPSPLPARRASPASPSPSARWAPLRRAPWALIGLPAAGALAACYPKLWPPACLPCCLCPAWPPVPPCRRWRAR